MNKSFFYSFSLIKLRNAVRSIIALGTIGILLFATTSCEKEPPVFEPQTRVLYVYKTDTYGYLLFRRRLVEWSQSTPVFHGDFYAPVYLPEAYRRHGLEVNVTSRQIAGRGNHPVVEILEIEERVFTDYRFLVLETSWAPCDGVLLQSDWGGFLGAPRWVVKNLPEKYNRNGLNVYVTHRRLLERECLPLNMTNPVAVEVIEIRSVVYSSRFYVRYAHKLGHYGYFLVEDLGDPEPRVLYPVNLPDEYQQEGLNVNVTYRRLWLDRIIYCEELLSPPIPTIEIISIMETPEERAATRILGGERDFIRNHPWLVLLSLDDTRDCAGSIIAPNRILTARHCVRCPTRPGNDRYPSTWVLADPNVIPIRVYAGIDNRNIIHPPQNRFTVEEIIPYPNDVNVDAVVLRLDRSIPPHIGTPINIWGASNPALYNIGTPVRVAGWGRTERGVPTYLQAVNLNISSGANVSNPTLQPHEMAATGTGPGGVHQGIAPGDSGGALTVRYPGCNTPVHIGIVSRGGGSDRDESVFVRTSHLMPWLERFRPRPTTPPAISGPNILCVGSEFTIRTEPGVPVTWRHSHGLQRTETSIRTGVGIFRATRVSAQADWVEAVVNGVPSRRHELWVGTPFIERIQHTGTGFGTTTSFRAMISMISPQIQWGLISRFTWEIVDTPHWEASFIGDTNSPEVTVQFHIGGPYMITVRATNACGQSMAAWINVLVFGENILLRESATTDRYSPSRPISGSLLVLLSDEESGRRRHTYDVRIYDSWGNRVKQVIAEDGSAGFDLSDLPDGTYYLHICNGVDEPMIQPIVVENRN